MCMLHVGPRTSVLDVVPGPRANPYAFSTSKQLKRFDTVTTTSIEKAVGMLPAAEAHQVRQPLVTVLS